MWVQKPVQRLRDESCTGVAAIKGERRRFIDDAGFVLVVFHGKTQAVVGAANE